jgi:DNA (cytosine-5)-methyltransferase 1
MNVGSLFSGIGGLDHGLSRAGFRHAFFCESDPWRRAVLAERWPGVPVYDDVRAVRLEPASGGAADGRSAEPDGAGRVHAVAVPVDLLCGGFPCQDLSVAGRRAGLEGGDRSSLFFEFARCADELVPAGGWILVENVPGLLSSQSGRDFAIVLATLAELGFHDLAWRVLDSRYFGVPQRRRRVFIVGRRASGRRAFEVLLEPESGGGDPTASGEAGAGAAGTPAVGTREGIAGPLMAIGDPNDQVAYVVADTLTSGSHPGSNMPGRRREDDTNLVAFHPTQDPIHGAISPALGVTTGGMNVAPANGVRRLTPVECERLQGLPDDWTRVPDTAPDSRRYAGLGDAVTSPVGYWIGRRILKAAA